MTAHSHETAPTEFIEANGIRFAYRRFGGGGRIPLVFLQYFSANMDAWDPAVTNGFAADREVILFNNAGIASSRGETPASVLEMMRDCVTFLDALGLEQIDVLGYSLGGMIAQQLSLDHPNYVRRVIVHGNHDIVVSPINALILTQRLPHAQLIIYPDSGHGAPFQHAGLFLKHATMFLSA